MAAKVRVGISGWRYPAWRGDFYPQGLPQRRELEYAASQLTSIEVNGSFYSLQRPSSYAAWRAEATAARTDFVFAVKGPRFVTHMKRLRDVDVPLANFFASGVLGLGPALGPVLWQLPENLPLRRRTCSTTSSDGSRARRPRPPILARRHDDKVPGRPRADRGRGRSAAAVRAGVPQPDVRRPRGLRGAAQHGVATVYADTAGRWPKVDEDTASFRYVRLHGDKELYASGYSDRALDQWAERCRGWATAGQDVFCYFDNDMKGHAPHDAQRLIARLISAS